jgi:hypothetical protein
MAPDRAALLALILSGTAAVASAARAEDRPRLHTNQAYVEEVAQPATLDVTDVMAVLGLVVDSLPERVRVYPTENYYYFSFIHGGVPYVGNIRLDASDRDEGKVNFGYYRDYAPWREEAPMTFRLLGAADGVRLEKLDRFVYRLSYRERSVVFELNDLSQVKPPAGELAADETFIGPIYDESATRFFLVFNRRLKIFHYVLDETVPVGDALTPARFAERILIGTRTGFAYYRDQRRDRKILIGVFEGNSHVNNYFDGPFDQLPDNFIDGDTLRDALIAINPRLKDKVDRFGGFRGGEQRIMIAPYLHYRTPEDLRFFDQCATSAKTPATRYYACFSVADPRDFAEPPDGRKTPAKAVRKSRAP